MNNSVGNNWLVVSRLPLIEDAVFCGMNVHVEVPFCVDNIYSSLNAQYAIWLRSPKIGKTGHLTPTASVTATRSCRHASVPVLTSPKRYCLLMFSNSMAVILLSNIDSKSLSGEPMRAIWPNLANFCL